MGLLLTYLKGFAMFNLITENEINTSTLINSEAKKWALNNLTYLNKQMKFLGTSTKIEKGEKEKFYTAVMYLQPANKVAQKTICAGAKMAGCLKGCLISSGMLGMSTGQNAATKRTILVLLRPEYFEAKLIKEIQAQYKKHGKALAIRLNGTSDLDFSFIYNMLPEVQFYEYTKLLKRVQTNTIKNLHLTYSGSMHSKSSRKALQTAFKDNLNIALAFNTKELTSDDKALSLASVSGKIDKLVSFDDTDLRFLDAPSSVGWLSRKGSNKTARDNDNKQADHFFINSSNINQLIAIGG